MAKYSSYSVQQHDDIRGLAHKLLGDQARWRELVELNKLEYPFISNTEVTGKRVLTIGNTLIYPGRPVATLTTEFLESTQYGRDLKLEKGYLVVQGHSLAVITGIENLKVSLERRIATKKGGLPAHRNTYGNGAFQYIGEVADEINEAFVKLELDKIPLQDSRIESVETSESRFDVDALTYEAVTFPKEPGVVIKSQVQL